MLTMKHASTFTLHPQKQLNNVFWNNVHDVQKIVLFKQRHCLLRLTLLWFLQLHRHRRF